MLGRFICGVTSEDVVCHFNRTPAKNAWHLTQGTTQLRTCNRQNKAFSVWVHWSALQISWTLGCSTGTTQKPIDCVLFTKMSVHHLFAGICSDINGYVFWHHVWHLCWHVFWQVPTCFDTCSNMYSDIYFDTCFGIKIWFWYAERATSLRTYHFTCMKQAPLHWLTCTTHEQQEALD